MLTIYTVAADDLKRVQSDIECNAEIRGQKRDQFAKISKRVRSLSPDHIRHKRADTATAKLGAIPELLSPPMSPEQKVRARSL